MCDSFSLLWDILYWLLEAAFEAVFDFLLEVVPFWLFCYNFASFLLLSAGLIKWGNSTATSLTAAFVLCWPVGWGIAYVPRLFLRRPGRRRKHEVKRAVYRAAGLAVDGSPLEN